MHYLFFLSYARADTDRYLDRFFSNLCEEVAKLAALPPQGVGFRDTSHLTPGQEWPKELQSVLSSCCSLVPLLSPNYLSSSFCNRELQAFHSRSEGASPPLILPVNWIALGKRSQTLPPVLRRIQGAQADTKMGIRNLLMQDRRKSYKDFLASFARNLVEAVDGCSSSSEDLRGTEEDTREHLGSEWPDGELRPGLLAAMGPRIYRLHRSSGDRPGSLSSGDDLLSLVETVCRLRYPRSRIERTPGSRRVGDYLKVWQPDDDIAPISVVGAANQGIGEETVKLFVEEVVSRYRANDPGIRSVLVYGGAPAPADLIRDMRAWRVRLVSFVEFQGLIDFRSFVKRQTTRLSNDALYPPKLYVPQRAIHLGQEGSFDDALAQIRSWLDAPQGRFILVLGDFGSGKTFLLHELARRMGQEDSGLVPVLLQMQSLEKGRSLNELLAQHFVREDLDDFTPRKFRYMLREGRIVLLFDGFDELALRVTYPRATEHFDTLIEAAGGAAKVVVTSRRQHFVSEQQVINTLGRRVELQAGHRIVILQPFSREQIHRYLVGFCGDAWKAELRLGLIERVRDLLGLSHNPRMLGFIAELPEEQLLLAGKVKGGITPADLYRLLLERWLEGEAKRVAFKGAAPNLSAEERWGAVTALALHLWRQAVPSLGLSELAEDTAYVLEMLSKGRMDPATAAFQVGSGTLLIRDSDGNFSFLHQSILEWLVAREAAREIVDSQSTELLSVREISPLMADFLIDLGGVEHLSTWSRAILSSQSADIAKSNALLLIRHLGRDVAEGEQAIAVRLVGQDLRGKDLSGQDLRGAEFVGANLAAAQLVRSGLQSSKLVKANLRGADLTGSDLSNADLSGADLTGACLMGADMTATVFRKAVLRRAKLVGAVWKEGALADCDLAQAAWMVPGEISTLVSSLYRSFFQLPVAWSSDGDLVASADGAIVRIWEVSTGRELGRFRGHSARVWSVSFSVDARMLASGSDDQTVCVWLAGEGEEILRLKSHRASVLSVCFSPDGRSIVGGSGDGMIRIWDLSTGRELIRWRGHKTRVWSVTFSPDGQSLASTSDDCTVRIWSCSGRELRCLRDHKASVLCVKFSPDGRTLASGSDDQTVRMWEAGTGREIHCLRGHESAVFSVSFSPDNRVLASGSGDQTIRTWEVGTGRELRKLHGHENRVWSVSFSPDGESLASGSDDQTVRVWDMRSGRESRRMRGSTAAILGVDFNPDGGRLASGSEDRTVRIWDLKTGREVRRIEASRSAVWAVKFSPDGRLLAYGAADGLVSLWNAENWQESRRLVGHTSGVLGVCFSPNGRSLASASGDLTVRIWDVESGRQVQLLRGHKAKITGVTFYREGRGLISSAADGNLRSWDLETGKENIHLNAHGSSIWSMDACLDLGLLVSGSEDAAVRVWNLESREEICCLRGHLSRVRCVSFGAEGRRVASGSDDGSVLLWDWSSGEEVQRLIGHESGVHSLAFSPDGKYLVSGSLDNTVRLWNVASGRCLAVLVHLLEGWVAFAPDGRYKIGGVLAGGFWHVIGLCRFEPGELDPYVPGLRLSDDASFLDLPPWNREKQLAGFAAS